LTGWASAGDIVSGRPETSSRFIVFQARRDCSGVKVEILMLTN